MLFLFGACRREGFVLKLKPDQLAQAWEKLYLSYKTAMHLVNALTGLNKEAVVNGFGDCQTVPSSCPIPDQ